MPIILENFDSANEYQFQSYSAGQDLDPEDWELINGELHLYGNTWKKQVLDVPVVISPDSVWQISVYLDNCLSQIKS